jgi:hypothetical protein
LTALRRIGRRPVHRDVAIEQRHQPSLLLAGEATRHLGQGHRAKRVIGVRIGVVVVVGIVVMVRPVAVVVAVILGVAVIVAAAEADHREGGVGDQRVLCRRVGVVCGCVRGCA